MAKPKLILLTMGGTISTPPADGAAKLNATALLNSAGGIHAIADIEGRDVMTRPSASLTLDDLDVLAATIEKASNEADGVVVTHGTDTLEETAYFLSLVLKTEKPVVLTGAMRRAGVPGADGPANLIDACRVAVSPESRGKGVLVVMNNEIHAATLVQKSNSFLPDAFTSLGPLGWVAEDRVRFFLTLTQKITRLTLGDKRPVVPLLETGTAFDKKVIAAFESFDGIVLNTTGVGHVADEAVSDLEKPASTRPIIFASRTGQGETFQKTYSYKGGEGDLVRRGLIPAGFLNGRQARMALILLLSTATPLSGIRDYFKMFSD